MKQLMNQLAVSMGQGPFIADKQGRYLIRIDGFSVYLSRHGQDYLLTSPLDWSAQNSDTNNSELLVRLASQVVSWARRYAQSLVIDPSSRLALQARLDMNTVELINLEDALMAQVGILEHLTPQLQEAAIQPQWKQAIWRP